MVTTVQYELQTQELLTRIETRAAKIGVVGLGYVGLPLALLFSDAGFRVTGFDTDDAKIGALNNGNSYIVHIPSQAVQAARESGFRATSDYARLADLDAVIICVPTPLNRHSQPDLSYITRTAEAMVPYVHPGLLVILESTTYPGSTQELLVPILEKSGILAEGPDRNVDDGFFVAFSPEREDPGNKAVARQNIPKVVGGIGRVSSALAMAVYRSIFNRVVAVSSPAAAEMTKLLENIYRCVNIALVNELKLLCLRMKIDIWEVIEAASTKPFGFQPFQPGPGLGGHCIPIDPFYLSWKAREFDFHTRFIELAGEINAAMPSHVVATVSSALNQRGKALNKAGILVLGIAYKKDVDDLRESPALRIITLLQQQGANVRYHDPYFPHVGRGRHYELDMDCATLDDLNQYDCVLIVTDHSDYDFQRIVRESSLVIDTRNATRGITSPSIVRC